MRLTVVLAATAVLVFGARDARAQSALPEGSAGTTQSAAEALFVEGKRLMAQGAYAEACAKFAESERLDPAAGTLLNLADCYERNGQLASAWLTFREATTAAELIDRAAWSEQASARARLLEPRLSTLTVEIDPAAPPGIEVWCNGAPVARSTWGVPVPIDPSSARIEAHAPNKKGWTTTVTIDAEHSHVVVAVPALEDLAAEPARIAREEPTPRFQWTAQRVAAVSSVAVGVIGMGVAGGLALAAKGEENQAEGETVLAQQTADSTNAVREGNMATGIALVGGFVAVAGIVLWLAAPHARARVTLVGPSFVLGGSF